MNKCSRLIDRFLDIFFVKACLGCGELLPYDHKGYLCEKCLEEWEEAKETVCVRCLEMQKKCRCGFGREHIDGVRHLALYDHNEPEYIVNRIMYTLKQGRIAHSFDFIAQELADNLIDKRLLNDAVVVNVPRSPKSIKKYGYDHSKKVADRLADILGIEYVDFIRHSGGSVEQKTLNKHLRNANARKTCYAREKLSGKIAGKTVFLVDDIGTTGAMMGACAALLHNHGAKKVYCILAAKNK